MKLKHLDAVIQLRKEFESLCSQRSAIKNSVHFQILDSDKKVIVSIANSNWPCWQDLKKIFLDENDRDIKRVIDVLKTYNVEI